METDSNSKGAMVELQCMSSFIKNGFIVSTPHGGHARYDFVADKGGKMLRVQCKTSTLSEDGTSFSFQTRVNTTTSRGYKSHSYTEEDVDLLATVVGGTCYVVPISECGGSSKTLRLRDSRRKAYKNSKYAGNYVIEKQLQDS